MVGKVRMIKLVLIYWISVEFVSYEMLLDVFR